MKTFDDLKIGDSIYEIDLINNIVKDLVIVKIENTDYDVNSKWFSVKKDKYSENYTSFIFRKQAFSDSDMSKTKIWLVDENLKDSIVYIFNCGIKYNQRQVRKAIGI